jgi:hypothetical protein
MTARDAITVAAVARMTIGSMVKRREKNAALR